MAGKHNGLSGSGFVDPAYPVFYPGSQPDRAYAEGRLAGAKGGVAGDNPNQVGSFEYAVWEQGRATATFSLMELQTFIPAI